MSTTRRAMEGIEFREFMPSGVTKPLITGWVPSAAAIEMVQQGRGDELPGHWLYDLQFRLPGRLGRWAGWLFGRVYAGRRIRAAFAKGWAEEWGAEIEAEISSRMKEYDKEE